MIASAPVPRLRCHDSTAYRCSVRTFRPGVGWDRSETRDCASENACFDLQVFHFDTNAAAHEDHLPIGAFEEGGEFNHDVFECEYNDSKVEGLSLVVAEASTLGEAWARAQRTCDHRMTDAH